MEIGDFRSKCQGSQYKINSGTTIAAVEGGCICWRAVEEGFFVPVVPRDTPHERGGRCNVHVEVAQEKPVVIHRFLEHGPLGHVLIELFLLVRVCLCWSIYISNMTYIVGVYLLSGGFANGGGDASLIHRDCLVGHSVIVVEDNNCTVFGREDFF